jgi:hypothetical protein
MIPSFSSLSLHPIVIPAEEGVAKALFSVTSAKAEVQDQLPLRSFLDARLRGHDVFSRFATPSEAGIQEPAYQQPVLDPRFRGGDECERCQGNLAFDNRPENLTKPLQKLPEMRGWLRSET